MKIKPHTHSLCENHLDLLNRLANHMYHTGASIGNVITYLDLTDEEIDYIDSAYFLLYEKESNMMFKKVN